MVFDCNVYTAQKSFPNDRRIHYHTVTATSKSVHLKKFSSARFRATEP